MKKQLRILFVEDSIEDAELEERDLRMGGLDFVSRRVDSREEIQAVLHEFKPNLVISDFTLPGLDGLAVLRIVRSVEPDLPFIFVSGTIGEERAIEAMKSGATDYMVKGRLGALIVKIHRALREAEDREHHRKLELKLRQTQKLEVVGRLAGGVAHDFNNLLTAILGFTEMSLASMSKDSAVYSDLEEVFKAGQKAATLTRQLLAFGRQEVLQPRVLVINESVTNLVRILNRLVGEKVELITKLAPGIGNICADPGQIEQVILNLCVNARDAMTDGGKLVVETANEDPDPAGGRGKSGPPRGRYVTLQVSDTGTGMTPEVKARIFEPFFTTKDVGKGTGLGLATVHGIVKELGGHIELASEVGKGTTFKIYFLRVEEVAPPKPASVNVPRKGGAETILLVEDEESVSAMIVAALRMEGYNLLVAKHGEEALDLAKRHKDKIHLAITDMVMPGMSGWDFGEKFMKDRPDARIIYMSGYTDPSNSQRVVPANVPFLQKPFSLKLLVLKLREVLDTPIGLNRLCP